MINNLLNGLETQTPLSFINTNTVYNLQNRHCFQYEAPLGQSNTGFEVDKTFGTKFVKIGSLGSTQ